MSAPITEAHRQAAVSIFELAMKSSHHGAPFREPCAQLIADSEAKAVVEIAMVAAESADRNVSLRLERDQLRAECNNLNNLLRAVGWGQGEIDSAACIEEENEKLRAEVERLKSDGAASAFINMSCRASRAETDRNNLRADLDAIKAILNEEKARAERAEAILGKLQELHGCSQEMVIHWCEHAAKRSLALDKAQAELAAERARLDWLEDNAGDIPKHISRSFIWFAHQNLRAEIDAAMKEGAK